MLNSPCFSFFCPPCIRAVKQESVDGGLDHRFGTTTYRGGDREFPQSFLLVTGKSLHHHGEDSGQ